LCVITDEWVDLLNSQHKELPVPIVYEQRAAM